MDDQKLSRRTFLKDTAVSALAITVLAPIAGSQLLASSRSAPIPFEPIALDLTKQEFAALTTVGGAMKIPDPRNKKRPLIISRLSETSVAAVSSSCTHFGCEVGLPVNNVAVCPCHGSQFDASGKVLKGPAHKNLSPLSATLQGNVITIREDA